MGMKILRKVSELFRPARSSEYEHSYAAVPGTPTDLELSPPKSRRKATPRWKKKLPFRRIFTYNVICTLIAHSLMATHLGTFNNLWYVFLSTPVAHTINTEEIAIRVYRRSRHATTGCRFRDGSAGRDWHLHAAIHLPARQRTTRHSEKLADLPSCISDCVYSRPLPLGHTLSLSCSGGERRLLGLDQSLRGVVHSGDGKNFCVAGDDDIG